MSSHTRAQPAGAVTIPKAIRPQILRRQGVTALAVSLSSIACRHPVPAQDVLLTRDGLKMGGIDAPSIAAEVVEFQVCSDRTFGQRIREAVSVYHAPGAVGTASYGKLPIPAAEFRGPQPTAIITNGDVLPEAHLRLCGLISVHSASA